MMPRTRRTLRYLIGTLGMAALSGLPGYSPLSAQTVPPAQKAAAPATPIPSDMSRHTMDGDVTKVDAKKGWIDVKTPEGRMKLHFPPPALASVKVGDRVSIELGMTAAGTPQR
jgi:hypothetical protein